MDKDTKENWQKIKTSLEEQGATDNYYYKRAVAIVSGGPDPLDQKLGETEK